MSKVRVLVGTKKGAFILNADGKRQNWEISAAFRISRAGRDLSPERLARRPLTGPHFITPRRPAAWFGQIIQRSDDGGKTWHTGRAAWPGDRWARTRMPGGESNKFVYERRRPGNAQVAVRRHAKASVGISNASGIWKPSLTDPDTVYAGAWRERGTGFKTTDGGKTWKELPGLLQAKGHLWQPGAGGMAVHTIVIDPKNPERIFVAISAGGVFRTEDGGKTWRPATRGLKSPFALPDPDAEVGHCVHRIAIHPSRPDVLFMQKHWDVMRSDNGGDSWHEVSGNLPSDFGFPIDVHAHEPETIYVVPIKSDSEHYPPDGKLRVYRSKTGGNEWEALTKGLPQKDCYVNVLRDAMAVDRLDPCGIYFGTTGGQVYGSADGGNSWNAIVRDLPAVLSVEAQVLP